MQTFEFTEDVKDWLAPMNYEEFWRAIRPHCLVIHPRSECDALIASGEAQTADVLESVKIVACRELVKRHGLSLRPVGPVLRVVQSSDG